MMVIGKDENHAGHFAYEIIDQTNTVVERVGKFSGYRECEQQATIAHRFYHDAMMSGRPFSGLFFDCMSIEEILAEFGE